MAGVDLCRGGLAAVVSVMQVTRGTTRGDVGRLRVRHGERVSVAGLGSGG